jgi:YVTN family beta-propeller protein
VPPAQIDRRWAELAYAAFRVAVALLLLFHAPQKMLGWYGGPQFPVLSLRGLASAIELVASALIAIGLFTPWAAAAAAAEMIGAYVVVHLPRGGWPIENRGELAILYLFVFLYMAVRGSGRYSLDHALRRATPMGRGASVAAVLGTVLAAGAAVYWNQAAAIAADGVRVFVTNEASGDLSVIDGATQSVIATVPLGKRPRGIKISPDGRSIFVALSGSPSAPPGVERDSLPPADRAADGIGEVDVATLQLRRIIQAGIDPEQLEINGDGTRLYVANEETAQVSVVNVAAGRVVATVNVGDEPEGVTLRPDGKVLYVTSEADGSVFAIDTATNTVLKEIGVGHRPRSVAFLPDGSRAFVTLENDAAIAVIDGFTHTFFQLIDLGDNESTPTRPMGLAVHPDGSQVYATTGSFGSLFMIDPIRGIAAAALPVGARPWGVGVTADGRFVYTANGPSNDVALVDVRSRQVVKRIPVGERPWGVALR